MPVLDRGRERRAPFPTPIQPIVREGRSAEKPAARPSTQTLGSKSVRLPGNIVEKFIRVILTSIILSGYNCAAQLSR